MLNRTLLGMTLAVVSCFCASALAADESKQNTHDGKVVSFQGDTLVMKGTDGSEHSHALASGATLTLDGKTCRATDLKPGTLIRVTTQSADGKIATAIEAIQRNASFANTHCGQLVSYENQQLVITDSQGAKQNYVVASGAKWWCDGRACQVSDLKAGMRVRVTTNKSASGEATVVEALNQRPTFAGEPISGKFVSITGQRLLMTNEMGQQEYASVLAPGAKFTCDGQGCQAADLKPGMRIRVQLQDEKPYSATHIEALDKNPEFASR